MYKFKLWKTSDANGMIQYIFSLLCATALFNFVPNIISPSIYTLYTYLINMKYPIKYLSLKFYT
jgi:hypothetical protein